MTGQHRHETLDEWHTRVDARNAKTDASPHYVYRAYDDLGLLLYIGCSVDADKRLTSHKSTSPWRPYMATYTVSDPYPSKAHGRAAEKAAIDTERSYFAATQEDTNRTQANLNEAKRRLHELGIYRDHFDIDESTIYTFSKSPEWHAHLAENAAYDELVTELRAELKSTTHPYLTPEDRMENYLRARAKVESGGGRADRSGCFYCGELSHRYENDHAPIPQRHGGEDTVKACPTCHNLKDRIPASHWPVALMVEALEQCGPLGRIFLAKAFAVQQDREAGVA